MSSDSNIRCRIKRSDRPCLICTGYMDLIEARPPKFNLFSGIPLICNSEGIDCLDCPKCGFTSTTADYQYLRLCKSDRQGKGMFINSETNSDPRRRDSERSRTRHRRQRREISISHSKSFSNKRYCSSCQQPIVSTSWQFCPACGTKCSPPKLDSLSPKTTNDTNKTIISSKIPNDVIIIDANSITENETEEHSESIEMPIDSKPVEKEIVRMVTPPKRTSMNTDFYAPAEMQY